MKSVLLLLLAIGLAGGGVRRPAPAQPASRYPELARRTFGAEILRRPLLFEVSGDYLLELQLDRGGEIKKIEVAPRYFWEEYNPDWKEPGHKVGLSRQEYQELLSKVGRLKDIGPLVHKGNLGVVTNSRLWLTDRYERGFIVRRVEPPASPDDASPEPIYSFSLYFIRGLRGTVEDKHVGSLPDGRRVARLKISGRWYLADPEDAEKVRKGERASVRAAGPVDD